ncbi:hypothetical protein HYU22_00235 [Candidatus Woesearchaeota archaeon]|nr:hypothetical protein [Candidatus Woesearchaeota archaeon]
MAKGKESSGGNSAVLGSWAFLIGLILAVLLGLGLTGPYASTMVWVVFLLGIVVGLLNVTHNETTTFMTSGTVLVLVSFLGATVVQSVNIPYMANILNGILTLFVPATIIVALRSVFVLARR